MKPNHEVKGTKFADKMTRIELTEEQLHTIAMALISESHNDACAPSHSDYCYQLGRNFMELFKAKPEPTPFDNL